jgi:hypothetical protein
VSVSPDLIYRNRDWPWLAAHQPLDIAPRSRGANLLTFNIRQINNQFNLAAGGPGAEVQVLQPEAESAELHVDFQLHALSGLFARASPLRNIDPRRVARPSTGRLYNVLRAARDRISRAHSAR